MDKCTRWLKEAIWIRRRGKQTLYKDKGVYKLHNIYDQLILTMLSVGTSQICNKGAVMSALGRQSDEAARVAVKRHLQIFLDLTIWTNLLFVCNNPDELMNYV